MEVDPEDCQHAKKDAQSAGGSITLEPAQGIAPQRGEQETEGVRTRQPVGTRRPGSQQCDKDCHRMIARLPQQLSVEQGESCRDQERSDHDQSI